jgi:hypothetical protein
VETAGKISPCLIVSADDRGWLFFSPPLPFSGSLSFLKPHQLSLFLYYLGLPKPLPALMGMKHSSRCLLLRRKMAENAAENTEVRRRESRASRDPAAHPDHRAAAAVAAAAATAAAVPNFPQLHPACSCRGVCVCVLGVGGDDDGACVRSPPS